MNTPKDPTKCKHSHCTLERDHKGDHLSAKGEYWERAR